MASLATVKLTLQVVDATGILLDRDLLPVSFAPGAGISGQMQAVTLTNGAFTALTVPTGAKLLIIELLPAAVSLVLKGVTGDTGINLTPASNFPGIPLLIPLGASPSIGLLNNATASVTVNVVWV